MLGCTCRIKIGIQWPRIRCSRDYAQHQLGRIQCLWPTLPILSFHVLQSFMLKKNIFITHVFPSFLLNTNINTHVLHIFSLNTNIKYSCAPELLAQHKTSHQLCASGSMPNTWNHVHKTYAFGLRPIYKKNHHVHMQWGLRYNIPIKTSK